MAQALPGPDSLIPILMGASGTISNVLGADLLFASTRASWCYYRSGPMRVLVELPAIWVLGFWIVPQASIRC